MVANGFKQFSDKPLEVIGVHSVQEGVDFFLCLFLRFLIGDTDAFVAFVFTVTFFGDGRIKSSLALFMLLEPALVYLCGFLVEFRWIFIQLQGFRPFSDQRPYTVILDESARAYRIYSGKAHNFFKASPAFIAARLIFCKRDGSSQRRQGIPSFHAGPVSAPQDAYW